MSGRFVTLLPRGRWEERRIKDQIQIFQQNEPVVFEPTSELENTGRRLSLGGAATCLLLKSGMRIFYLVDPTYSTIQIKQQTGQIAVVLESQIKYPNSQIPVESIPPTGKKEMASVGGKSRKQESGILLVSKPAWCSEKGGTCQSSW